MFLETKFEFLFPSYIGCFWIFKIVIERQAEEHGLLALQRVNCKSMSVQTLLAYWYVKAPVIYVLKHFVLLFKNLWLIYKIPMPLTFLLQEISLKEYISLWTQFKIQVCWSLLKYDIIYH